ncbi:MAG: phosphonate ABC transporter ATP-binding protein [Bdellovibrionales bacterium]|nr:phosphonate ABC transporter ATP-binding protein [Bdellovibrionales bacterium]
MSVVAHVQPSPTCENPTSEKPPILIEGLRKSFGPNLILKDISLKVSGGSAVALVGSNGSGKSTLLRCMVRLIEPDSGTIHLLGKNVRSLRGAALRKLRSRVGFVFQKHNLVPRLSALTNVLHGAQGTHSFPRVWFQCIAPQALRERALVCLNEVGLADFASRPVDKLSGGQSQRVAIARALMQEPEIILADEPVASLDPEAGEQIMELLARLARENGISLIFSTHHLEHAIEYSERVIGLRKGVFELDKPNTELTTSDLRSFYEPSRISNESE